MKVYASSRMEWLRRFPWAVCAAAMTAAGLLAYSMTDIARPAPPELSAPGRIHNGAVALLVSASDARLEIYATTNGDLPKREPRQRLNDGRMEISETTTLRATVTRPWAADSPPTTASYIFPGQIAWQSTIPPNFPNDWRGTSYPVARRELIVPDYAMDVRASSEPTRYQAEIESALASLRSVSLVLKPNDLFDLDTGIYPNSLSRGAQWERPVSMEIFDATGALEIQADAGLRVNGLTGRNLDRNPKLGFRIMFRKKYGAGQLGYPVFGAQGRSSFDSLVLRNFTQDSWVYPDRKRMGKAHYIRDQFARESQAAMGHPHIRGTFVHLYLNGLYWGIYNLCERVDASFLTQHFGGGEHEFDVINADIAERGDRDAWDRLARLSLANSAQENYESIQALVDVDSLIDYILLNQFIDNGDWFVANWMAIRKREPGGRFRFLVFDAEVSLGSLQSKFDFLDLDELMRKQEIFTPIHLFHRLGEVDEFKVRFADRVRLHLFNGGVLSEANARARWRVLADSLDSAIVAESARWGDCNEDGKTRTREKDWRPYIEDVERNYFSARIPILFEHYRRVGLFPQASV